MSAITGGASKSKSKGTQSQSFNQTTNTSLSDRAYGALTDRIGQIGGQSYQRLDPNAYKEYEDPYQDDVINATTADIMAARDQAGNADRAMLAGAGAFGDKRRGIVEAETAGEYDRTLATTLAGLRSRGYSQAQGIAQGENTNANAYQADLQRRIDALMSILGNETTSNSRGSSSGRSTGQTTGMNLGFTYGG